MFYANVITLKLLNAYSVIHCDQQMLLNAVKEICITVRKNISTLVFLQGLIIGRVCDTAE